MDKESLNILVIEEKVINTSADVKGINMSRFQHEHWKNKVVYHIYPKSFADSNGDGIGDLQGIIQKLDYLAFLGIDYIWITPIYPSPQKDNGYDVSDYYSVDKMYGSMEDLDTLIKEAHKRGIRIMMDMVLNHTSTEHEWFIESRKSKNNPYRDYYIWKAPKNGGEPNNWKSKFGGSAWEIDPQTEEYYLHLFDKHQADLNWENEEVRQKVYDIIRFWLDKGVEGLRFDVLNLISKDPSFPDDEGGDGRKFYTDGPKVHEYLQEMNREVLSKYDVLTIGEMSSTTIEECIKYTNPERHELDMVFNFHHLKVDYPNFTEKWELGEFDLLALKKVLSEWQEKMIQGNGWNALFWCNHDQPRIVSRFGNDREYLKESAKMLATTLHLMRGTPYIYQGEEIGMTNPNFTDIKDFRDVETLNMYQILKEQGKEEKEIMEIIQNRSRDNGRTPMQWNDTENAGFTSGNPWIKIASNYREINVEKALKDKKSILYHYKKLIELRKELDIITYGDYRLILEEHPHIFAYVRRYGSEILLVLSNFSDQDQSFELQKELFFDRFDSGILISNYDDSEENFLNGSLRPYESIAYFIREK